MLKYNKEKIMSKNDINNLFCNLKKNCFQNVWKENMALDAQTFAAIASIVHATMRLASAS